MVMIIEAVRNRISPKSKTLKQFKYYDALDQLNFVKQHQWINEH